MKRERERRRLLEIEKRKAEYAKKNGEPLIDTIKKMVANANREGRGFTEEEDKKWDEIYENFSEEDRTYYFAHTSKFIPELEAHQREFIFLGEMVPWKYGGTVRQPATNEKEMRELAGLFIRVKYTRRGFSPEEYQKAHDLYDLLTDKQKVYFNSQFEAKRVLGGT